MEVSCSWTKDSILPGWQFFPTCYRCNTIPVKVPANCAVSASRSSGLEEKAQTLRTANTILQNEVENYST
jgi:hypothetical protein